MAYFLLITLLVLLAYLIVTIVNRNSTIEKEVNSVLEQRLKFTAKEYQKSQENLLDLKFKEWMGENEFGIRRTAILTNNSNMLDKISRELSIIKHNFPFNPKDIKFIGRFTDLIIFDGAADEQPVNIYFVEIERQNLKGKQILKSKVENAVGRGSYSFQEINL
jgi:predicted Holliday junction resolvase-like endonuclease